MFEAGYVKKLKKIKAGNSTVLFILNTLRIVHSSSDLSIENQNGKFIYALVSISEKPDIRGLYREYLV